MGVLSLEVAAALEERWEEAARADARRAVERISGRCLRRLRRRLSDLAAGGNRSLARRLREASGLAGAGGRESEPAGPIGRRLRRERRRAERARDALEALVESGDSSGASQLERERRIADATSRWRDAVRLRARLRRERRAAQERGAVRLASEVDRLRRTIEASVAERRHAAESVLDEPAANVVAFARRTA